MNENRVVILQVSFAEGESVEETLGSILLACRDQSDFEIDAIRVATEKEEAELRLG